MQGTTTRKADRAWGKGHTDRKKVLTARFSIKICMKRSLTFIILSPSALAMSPTSPTAATQTCYRKIENMKQGENVGLCNAEQKDCH